jgi:hypothetical protein
MIFPPRNGVLRMIKPLATSLYLPSLGLIAQASESACDHRGRACHRKDRFRDLTGGRKPLKSGRSSSVWLEAWPVAAVSPRRIEVHCPAWF